MSIITQLCLTLCDPVDCSLPGSSVHEILETRILEWVAISSCRGSSPPSDQTCVSCTLSPFRLLNNIEESPVLYGRSSWIIHFKYSSVCMSIPNSLIQMEKDKYFMISLKCRFKKKKKRYKCTYLKTLKHHIVNFEV